jgi:hypothetical protein
MHDKRMKNIYRQNNPLTPAFSRNGLGKQQLLQQDFIIAFMHLLGEYTASYLH